MFWLVIGVLALALLGVMARRQPAPADYGGPVEVPAGDTRQYQPELVLGSYNINGCKGFNKRSDPGRIRPGVSDTDFAGLYEVEAGIPGLIQDQAQRIAAPLHARVLFAPVQHRWLMYNRGNALLTRLPLARWYKEPLPDSRGTCARCLLSAMVWMGESEIPVFMAHLSRRQDHRVQLETVLTRFLAHPQAILMGDLNTGPQHPLLRSVVRNEQALDALAATGADGGEEQRLDGILVRGLEVVEGGRFERGPSDHPAFWIRIRNPGVAREGSEAPRGGTAICAPAARPPLQLPDVETGD